MENSNTYELNIENLIFNVQKVKSLIGKSKLCAMVKADAYGHGAVDIAKILEGVVDFLGVASVFEAKELRESGIRGPILIVGKTAPENIEWCARNSISVAVSTVPDLKKISEKVKDEVYLHVKINTGMNRFGIRSIRDLKKIKDIVNKNNNLHIAGIFTHFSTKAEDIEFIEKQHELFLKYVRYLDKNIIVHCCNSYAAVHCPQFCHDMVRCGFCLYGWKEGFRPVLSIKSKLIAVYKVKEGESVGYGRTFKFKKQGRVGVVPLGYADGFDRRLSNNFKVLIKGQFVDVIGRICMDVFMVDLSNVKNACEGDEIIILGSDGERSITVHNYADALGTSEYEILLKFNYYRMNRKIIKLPESVEL